jgi:purine-binding chemotaxis protein CheW
MFGIELGGVHEVIDAPTVSPLPDAPPGVLGVAVIRDMLVPVYDPRPVLQVGGERIGALLLFQRDGRRVALAVDDVAQAMSTEREDIRPVPGAIGADTAGVLVGLVRRGRMLVAVLDADALMTAVQTVGERT